MPLAEPSAAAPTFSVVSEAAIQDALERLPPQDRALLELSLRRRVADGALAELLGVPTDQVERRREAALDRLVDQGAARSRQQADERLVAHWRGAAVAAPPPRRSWGRWLAVAALLVAAGAALIAATAGGGSSGRSESRRPEASTPRCSPSPILAFRRLNSTHGRGTVQLIARGRPRLRLRVSRFLVPQGGGYAVWLISSPTQARRLYSMSETSISRGIRLPRAWGHYRYVEVARAIPELTSPYSRLPLLRARLADLSPC